MSKYLVALTTDCSRWFGNAQNALRQPRPVAARCAQRSGNIDTKRSYGEEARETTIARVLLIANCSPQPTSALPAGGANGQRESLMDVAMAYFAFAHSRPALYEAMFILPTQLQFAEADTRSELRAGFDAIAAAVSPFCADVEISTETFWAAVHGLAELERSGRIRPGMRDKRIAIVVQAIVDAGGNAPGRG
ncbi:WHG domain-containing protein [Rhizobium sp. WSM1274]|uniref:TetR-like C-terminal domain-containing protein n=1 Tax=Rhizobium sp. WSM1274 TaxID=3138254 RepID=UPI0021A40BD3|nr:TetR-like C-terminal domain-containing protein [Rhizobium leguminosarum]UWU30792.1 WHG domain-containing protein [Rhizobium leguminosarum bv. viciae]